MKPPAFIASLSKLGWFDRGEREAFERLAADLDLQMSLPGCATMIAAAPGLPTSGAAILGAVHRRGEASRLTPEAMAGLRAGPKVADRLIEDCWGSYVAFGDLDGDGTSSALRAPFGDLPCYWHERRDRIMLASSVPLLIALGVPACVDWGRVAQFLAATDLRTGQTCLAGIEELGGGELLRASRHGAVIEERWSPWRWTGSRVRFRSRDEASAAISTSIDGAVTARVPRDRMSVLLLSGGLDSSSVAAALSANDRAFVGLTMVVADAQGDERAEARMVADHLGVRLVEVERDWREVDLSIPLAAKSPRPTGAQFRQATLAAADRLAAEIDAVAVLDGGGGDNMFCSLQSAVPVIDAALSSRSAEEVLATAGSIARMANVSMIAVLRTAASRLYRGRRGYRWPLDHSLLDPAMTDGFVPAHAWLAPPRRVLPGKAAQVGLLLAAKAVVERSDPDRSTPLVSPLVCQPVAEAVLRVPTWMWFEDGRNRAPIRRAVASRLPEGIVGRRSKGTPTGFLAALVETRADMLRPFLMDGLLAANHVVDRLAVERALAPGPARDLGFARVLQIADAEAWARSWS